MLASSPSEDVPHVILAVGRVRGDRLVAGSAVGEVVARDEPGPSAARRGVEQGGAARSRSAGGDDGTGRGVGSQDAAVRGDVADGYAAALNLDIAAGLDIAGQVCRTGRADEETADRVARKSKPLNSSHECASRLTAAAGKKKTKHR